MKKKMKKYKVDLECVPSMVLAKNIDDALKKVRKEITIVPEFICDNVECPDLTDGVFELFEVELKSEFKEFGNCYWCKKCMKRDRDMIARVIK